MIPTSSDVTETIWKRLYETAIDCQNKSFPKNGLFAFLDPDTGCISYCSIPFGNKGPIGLFVYRSREALDIFFRLQKKEIEPGDPELLHRHDALVVEFHRPKSLLEQQDLTMIKMAKIVGKKLPCFRSYRPGFKDWLPEEQEAQVLLRALELSLRFSKDFPLFPLSEGECILYISDKQDANKAIVHTVPPFHKRKPAPYIVDPQPIEKLKDIKLCRDGAWEISIINTTNVMSDHERPYFAKILLILHHDTALVLQAIQIPVRVSPPSFIAQELLSAIKKHKRLPGEFLFSDPDLAETLTPFGQKLGIRISFLPLLPATESRKKHLLEQVQ